MTAKEWIDEKENEVEELFENWDRDYLSFVMNEFSLHVVKQSIKCEKSFQPFSNSTATRILDRAKELTDKE